MTNSVCRIIEPPLEREYIPCETSQETAEEESLSHRGVALEAIVNDRADASTDKPTKNAQARPGSDVMFHEPSNSNIINPGT